MPKTAQRAAEYKTLAARLTSAREDIARQARARPLAEVPPETLRLVKRLLADLRRFAMAVARARIVPAMPQGTIRFSGLSLLVGETRARLEAFGARTGLDGPERGSPTAHYVAAEKDLAAMIAASTADIRRVRERQDAERARRTRDRR